MRKKFLIFLAICIIACLSFCLVACVDNSNFEGEARVTINLDKEYPEVSVNCPQGTIEKNDSKQYVVSLSNTLPVDILVACPGYETVIFSYTTQQLKKNSDITESVTFKNELYRFNFTVENNKKIELAEDYTGINLSIQSGRYVLESEKPITHDVKFNVEDEDTKPFVIFKEAFKYSGAKGALSESIPLLDKREINSAVIFIPYNLGINMTEAVLTDMEDFDMDFDKTIFVKTGEYKKVDIKNYVLYDRMQAYNERKILIKADVLKNNAYCNLATCDINIGNEYEKENVEFEFKDKLTGNILYRHTESISQGAIVRFYNIYPNSEYSVVGAEQIAYFKEIFGNKIVVELIKQYEITLHITNYQDLVYDDLYQMFSCGSDSNNFGFDMKQLIDNNGYVTLLIQGNMAGKKLQFVMNSFMNNEPKYSFILNIPANIESSKIFEIEVEAADTGW